MWLFQPVSNNLLIYLGKWDICAQETRQFEPFVTIISFFCTNVIIIKFVLNVASKEQVVNLLKDRNYGT